MFKVKVYGDTPYKHNAFGGIDIFLVDKPSDVTEKNGVLIITTPGQPERPHPRFEGKTIPATRSSQIIYPRGGWDKIVIQDIITNGDTP